LWAECRQVTKQALVSLFGNRYQVDPALVGATVELVFDPFDLGHVQVRYQQRPMGLAVPVTIGRHVHPAATPDPAAAGTPRPSGIDYLAMVAQRIAATQRQRIAYAALPPPPEPGVDAGAGAHEHAANPDHTDQLPTTIPPPAAEPDVRLQPPATITPDHPAPPAAHDATTKPTTNFEPTDTGPNLPPLIIIDATLEDLEEDAL
jgi:hypothetical protein